MRWTRGVAPHAEVEMESRFKILGHPVHPMLIVFPLGLLSTSVLADLLHAVTGKRDLARFSLWALIFGLVGGMAAAVFGIIDWMGIPSGTRAKRIGGVHGAGNGVVTTLFGLSLLSRLGNRERRPGVASLVFGTLGAGLAVFTAWLGGELVYRLRVGVDPGAHLDATNSLARDGLVEIDA
jgi:uncharacterized membrane protein